MPRIPQRLAVTVVPTLRQRLLSAVFASTNCILSFDPTSRSLVTYYWPVEGNKRVRPDALNNYRKTHQFLGPCCLCPLLTPLSEEYHFTEVAMYVPIFGRYAGEYVAECAKSHCGYLVPLERMYPKIGVPLKKFPTREDSGTACPPQVFHNWELEFMSSRALKRTYALYAPADFTDVPPENVDLGYETDWRKMVKLECLDRPGLSELEFFGLFAKCNVCNLVMARHVFSFHHCVLQTEDGLELTDVEE